MSKVKGKHQKRIPAVKKLIAKLKSDNNISKILLGEIMPCKPGAERITEKHLKGNLFEITVRGVSAIQKLRVVKYASR